jgi:AbrB family looped-hinge helix DNA binding protein
MRVTSKGQVTIPVEIREKLGLLPKSEVEFDLVGNAVRIRKARSRTRRPRGRSVVERLRGRGSGRMSTDEILSLTRGGR